MTDWRGIGIFLLMATVFAAAWLLPVERMRDWPRLGPAVWESLRLLRRYAREHAAINMAA